jgi:hypothetical protein
MDSLIHYEPADAVRVLAAGARTRGTRHRLHLRAAHAGAGRHARGGPLFPRGDRAPAIVPVAERRAAPVIARPRSGAGARAHQRVSSGFYTSQAMELVRNAGDAPSARNADGASQLGPRAHALLPFADAATAELPLGACCACRCSRCRSAWRPCC